MRHIDILMPTRRPAPAVRRRRRRQPNELMLMAVLLLLGVVPAACSAPGAPFAVAVLRDRGIPELFDVDTLVEAVSLEANLNVSTISAVQLADPSVLSPDRVRVLVVPNAPALPSSGLANYQAFAMGGGSLVLLGGKPTIVPVKWGDPAAHLNVMENYDSLKMNSVRSVNAIPNNTIIPRFNVTGAWAGLSAVGWAVPHKAEVIPVLVAKTSFERSVGWAASLVSNYGGWGPECPPERPVPARGCFVGSSFLVFGIATPSFYSQPQFTAIIGPAVSWVANYSPHTPATPPPAPPLPPDREPMRPLVVGRNKRTLVVKGTREAFHIVGVNLPQQSWANPQVENTVTPTLVRADVQKVGRLGFNVVRMACCWGPHGFVPNSVELTNVAMDALALQRTRVLYTLPVSLAKPPCTSEEECGNYSASTLRALLPRHRDAVFAVDVRNEVVAENLAAFRLKNGSTLGAAVGGWNTTLWQRFRAWSNVSRDFDNFRYVRHRLDRGLPPEFRAIWTATDQMYATFLSWLIPVVRRELPDALVCCGTFDELELLPAASVADFACHHSYPTVSGVAGQCDCPHNAGPCLTSPCGELETVPLSEIAAVPGSLTVIDSVFQENGAVRPLVHGETGISNGLKLNAHEFLDLHTSSVWEAMLYLSPIAHGFAGTIRWTVNDFEAYSSTASAIVPPPACVTETRDQRLGLFSYDGTIVGVKKPVAHALSFIARWLQTVGGGIFGPFGSLNIRDGSTSIHAGYTFTAEGVLFVGDRQFNSSVLSFRADEAASNVFVLHNSSSVRLMASADTRAWLYVSLLATKLNPATAVVTGRSGGWSWETTRTGECVLQVLLLQGEELNVKVRARESQNDVNLTGT